MKDYYTILQIPEDAGEEEIQKAYRRLAKQYHPDINKSKNAHDQFIEISEAYEFLMARKKQMKQNAETTAVSPPHTIHYYTNEERERFIREVHERAARHARMRYEKFKKQHEAFQVSGISDLVLLFTIFVRIFIIPFSFLLLIVPVLLALVDAWQDIVVILFTGPFAVAMIWYIHDNWHHYLKPGKLYYTPGRIRQIYTTRTHTGKLCYYCQNREADSRSFRLELYKLTDIKLSSGGFRLQNVNYKSDEASILIPRSQKAFIIHSAVIWIKIVTITGSLFFLDLSSIVWRLITGMAAGGLISSLLLLFTGTKSNVSYLYNPSMLIRTCLWLMSIILVSKFSITPFNINTTGSIYFVITFIFVFDSFVMQFLDFMIGEKASIPVFTQYNEAGKRFHEGYKAYNDIPVLSVFYPLLKWIVG